MSDSKPGYNERLRQLLFESGENSMNFTNLRDRIEDLSNRIDSVISCLSTTETPEAKWKAGLDAYILLNVHLQQLTESMRPIMKSYALCPTSYDPEEAQKWPELLATLLHPDQESKSQQIMKFLIENEDEAIRQIQSIDKRNELISDLIRVSRKPGSGLLDPKGPSRRKRAAKSAELRHIIRQNAEKEKSTIVKGHKAKRQKRLTVTAPDPVTGTGVLTNGYLFGYDLSE